MTQEFMLYNFQESSQASDWQIVNDGVMGGRSQSKMQLNAEGNGVFSGKVSLENNGGFASIRHRIEVNNMQEHAFVNLKVRGKPSTYQFRLKRNTNEAHSYIQEFQITSEWNTVQLKLSSFYPRFRGRSLNLSNFDANEIQEMAILIGNKAEENFELEIDNIYLSN
jgi:hypothetical protein